MGWLADLGARVGRWLEAGTRGAAARRVAPEPDADPGDEEPGGDGGVAELPIEDSIDLHHFRPRDVPSVVEAYLEAASERGLEEVLIIHGRGKGVQRSVVAKLLARHPLVESHRPSAGAGALGATVARIRRGGAPSKKTSRGF